MRGTQPPGAGARGNLPLELDAFVGRTAELAELAGLLGAARLVTVTGVGGVGKSRLAARAAARTRPRDGVWHVELSPVRDPDLVAYALAGALEPADRTARPPRRVLLDHLAGRRLLLVVDGFEQVVDACAALLGELLRHAPGLRVLAAGRRPLGLAGERVVPLAPLPEPEAAELFAARAAAAVPGFAAHDGHRADVLELCRRLDGIPLALELAAGRLRTLSPALLLARLDDRFGLLTGGGRDALPRHRTLRTAIGWSHELCAPQERLLWARLSVFAGRFELDAAEYVCGGDGLPAEEVLDALTSLLDQSVVTREETPAGMRYRMLDTVRAYGADWLAAHGGTARLRRRHRDWYLGLATWCELDWFSPRQDEVAALVETELPNLRHALEYCLTEPDEAPAGRRLAGSLWFYWVGCGRLAEGRHWLARSLDPDGEPSGPPEPQEPYEPARLKALWVLGHVAVLQGDTVSALTALLRCRQEAERADDATALAYAEHRTGCLALVTDDVPRAETLLRSALDRYRELGELNTQVLMGQVELAMALAFRGDLSGAVELCEEVRRVCGDHGERWCLTYAQYVLAYAAWTEGEVGRARELLADGLAVGHAFRDLLGTVLAVELLALVTAAEGDPAEAALLQGAADRMWASVGPPLFGSALFDAPHRLCETMAREDLGDARYEERLRTGRLLERDAVVARALGRSRTAALLPAVREAVRLARRAADTRQPAASPAPGSGETTG